MPRPKKIRVQRSDPRGVAKRNEIKVRSTDAAVPVKPRRPSAQEKKPVPAAALDRRRQIVGTNELKK